MRAWINLTMSMVLAAMAGIIATGPFWMTSFFVAWAAIQFAEFGRVEAQNDVRMEQFSKKKEAVHEAS